MAILFNSLLIFWVTNARFVKFSILKSVKKISNNTLTGEENPSSVLIEYLLILSAIVFIFMTICVITRPSGDVST